MIDQLNEHVVCGLSEQQINICRARVYIRIRQKCNMPNDDILDYRKLNEMLNGHFLLVIEARRERGISRPFKVDIYLLSKQQDLV